MSLTTRLVPRDEWATKLAGTDLGTVASYLPEETRIIAVEDNGVLVGCWSLTRMWQAEGLWMAPAAARSASVGRRLLMAMKHQAHEVGAQVLLTGAQNEAVRAMLLKIGARELPISLFAWPMETETAPCR